MPVEASIIIPAYNAADTLPTCLHALRRALASGIELVVVDDASHDGTAAIAEAAGARVLRLPANRGPAAARNHGVRHTTGAILVFVDADVVVAPDAIPRALRTLAAEPGLAGVFGSYDAAPAAPGLVSQFRNLLHHHVHQHGRADAFTFWAGCGALRREAFDAAGGFDERHARNAIEDVELGYRLRAAGRRLRLDPGMLCTHLKRWTLASMIRTDVACRAIPWARLLLQTGVAPRDLNLTMAQRWSVVLAVLLLASLPLAAWAPARAAAACAAAGIVALNWRLYACLRRARGAAFAAACVPLHVIHLGCGAAGFAWAWTEARLSGRGTVTNAAP